MAQRYCNARRTVKPPLPVLREVVRSVLILPSVQSYCCPLSSTATLLCNSSFLRYWLADWRTDEDTVQCVVKADSPIPAMLHSEQWSHPLCSTQSLVARRRADDINCCTAFRSSVLSSSLQTLCIKRRGSTCLAVSSFPSAILNFLTELGLIKLCSLRYACSVKLCLCTARRHRGKRRRAHSTMYS